MKPKECAYTYGPVPSRRLGRSLGVDLVPYKICSYDCVYCQLGRTTNLTLAREEYFPTKGLTEELKSRLAHGHEMDYVTVSGSGEPTLHVDVGRVIESIKHHSSVPAAVITNGSMLTEPEVREALCRADLVVPSLDAVDQQTFDLVNRPVPGLRFQDVFEGLVRFSREYRGKLWVEVFLLEGMNADEEHLLRFRDLLAEVDHARIQLNTVVRPPAEESARRVSPEKLQYAAALFGEKAEIIAPLERRGVPEGEQAGALDVLALLRRRPCTLADVAAGLNIHPNHAVKLLQDLEARGRIVESRREGAVFYAPYTGRRAASQSGE